MFSSQNLSGNGPDFTQANNWAKRNFGSSNVQSLSNGQIKINGELHTWHHHQDGLTMFPVPTAIHTARDGGFLHSGGKAVIKRNIKGFFNSPVF